MPSSYQVIDYSVDGLISIIANKSQSTEGYVKQKLHSTYFEGYFGHIGARTCVIEDGYIDKDYLEDYSGYYVRCFKDYGRRCTRIHFFKEHILEEDFDGLLCGSQTNVSVESLTDAYLGFIVVKPLPQAVIGRTCLKTYPCEERRYFPITRDYPVSLFGIPLVVRNTLAFQEQDSVVAACATSALWSVLHATGITYQHPIPSPVEITKAATEHLPAESRSFPNHGLSSQMMAHAIRSVGLEPFLVRARSDYILKGTIYAYLRSGIAAILGIHLYDTTKKPNKMMGMHAVAVTGYSMGLDEAKPLANTGFRLKAMRIDKLYVHDDQVGPFARMEFDGGKISVQQNGEMLELSSLSTSWRGEEEGSEIGSARALPDILLTPLYHKIRIPFEAVHDIVIEFDLFVKALSSIQNLPFEAELEWDLYLSTVNDFKREVLDYQLQSSSGDYYRDLLVEPLPKYIWRAKAIVGDVRILELMFDATDIEQGPFFIRAIECDMKARIFFRALAKDENLRSIHFGRPIWPILHWFSEQPIE